MSDFVVQAIEWKDSKLVLLDQRRLPLERVYLYCDGLEQVVEAIKSMTVRGAPAIAISAAYGMLLAAYEARARGQKLETALTHAHERLLQSRPTAVNLAWSLERMATVWQSSELSDENLLRAIESEAEAIHREDLEINRSIANNGAALIKPGSAVCTHCNTGALATAGIGTALGIIRFAYEQKRITEVYAGETRPWMQGSRLTAWELQQENIPVSIVTEGAAGQLMAQEKVQYVIVGADRVTANGDLANKIGTYNLAVLAKFHKLCFIAAVPTSTIDLGTSSGELIEIEQRNMSEVTKFNGKAIAPKGVKAINPSFDVTPAALIDFIVTEYGIIEKPTQSKIYAHMEKFL